MAFFDIIKLQEHVSDIPSYESNYEGSHDEYKALAECTILWSMGATFFLGLQSVRNTKAIMTVYLRAIYNLNVFVNTTNSNTDQIALCPLHGSTVYPRVRSRNPKWADIQYQIENSAKGAPISVLSATWPDMPTKYGKDIYTKGSVRGVLLLTKAPYRTDAMEYRIQTIDLSTYLTVKNKHSDNEPTKHLYHMTMRAEVKYNTERGYYTQLQTSDSNDTEIVNGYPLGLYIVDSTYNQMYRYNNTSYSLQTILTMVERAVTDLRTGHTSQQTRTNTQAINDINRTVSSTNATLAVLNTSLQTHLAKPELTMDDLTDATSGPGFWGTLFGGLSGAASGVACTALETAIKEKGAIKTAVSDTAKSAITDSISGTSSTLTKDLKDKIIKEGGGITGMATVMSKAQALLDGKLRNLQQAVHGKFDTINNIVSTIDTIKDWTAADGEKYELDALVKHGDEVSHYNTVDIAGLKHDIVQVMTDHAEDLGTMQTDLTATQDSVTDIDIQINNLVASIKILENRIERVDRKADDGAASGPSLAVTYTTSRNFQYPLL